MVPKTGGTYRFYQILRRAVEPLGWTVLGISIGVEARNWDESIADENCIRIGDISDSFKESAKKYIDWLIDNDVTVVMPVGSSIMSSAMPHTPPSIKFLMQGNNITRHTYATTLVHRDCVSHYIGISKRHYDDLINRFRVPVDKITLIPHAVDISDYYKISEVRVKRSESEILKIVYLGRIIDIDKGVLKIPKILDLLSKENIPFFMRIAGDGPDKQLLENKLKLYINDGRVVMEGNIPSDKVPQFFFENDIFLMPSNFEGFGFTLIEAMAAGCVPVVSSIEGVTNWIVTDNVNGKVCTIGSDESFYRAISELYYDKELHHKFSVAAKKEVADRFSLNSFAQAYDSIFNKLILEKNNRKTISINKLKLAGPYKNSWHDLVPVQVKIKVRRYQEKLKLILYKNHKHN